MAVIALLMLLATVVDIYFTYFGPKPQIMPGSTSKKLEKALPLQILLTFSVFSNFEKLMRTGRSPDAIGCLDGMRLTTARV